MTDTPLAVGRPTLSRTLSSLLQADAIVLVKNRRSLILSFAIPLLLLIATSGHKGASKLGGVLFLVALAITYGQISSSILGYSLNVARDRDKGVFQRLRVTPAPAWTIMLSRLAIQMVANLLIAIVALVAGVIIDHISLSAEQYVLVLVVAVLGGAVYLSIGQALVGLVRSADTINGAGRVLYIALVVLALLGLSGALGSTIQTIAQWSPMGTVMALFATVFHLTAWAMVDTWALIVSLAYVAVFTAVGVRWFHWDAR